MEKTLNEPSETSESLKLVRVDYPRQDEVISSKEYTFRVSVIEEAKTVEVSVDGGPWRPCRHSIGYWWFDWSGYAAGEHEVSARIETTQGRSDVSETRDFFVDFRAPAKTFC